MKRSGFTLIEVLVVIALVGILTALAVPNYLGWRARTNLQNAQYLVVSQLDKVRTEAKRFNATRTATWTATSFNGINLEPGVTLSVTQTSPTTASVSQIAYVAPYGTPKLVSGAIPHYKITLTSGSVRADVNVTGVFGHGIARPLY